MGRSETELDARAVAPPVADDESREPSPRSGRWARTGVVVALLALASVMSVVVRRVVYPGLSWNRDETTYLWQVRGLRAGDLLTTTAGMPQFFQPWLTGVRGGQFFSQYTLGWPGVMLVADVLFGSPVMAMVWGTMLAVLGTYVFTREVTRNHTLAVVTSLLMLASPMVITQSGVYLSYLFSLGVGLLFGSALFAGLRKHQWWLLLAAGVLLGILFITRPYDAVLWAAVMGGYAVFTTWRQWNRQFRAAALVFAGMVPFFVLTLAQNKIVTGSFTQFPFTAKEPLDKFGFGFRKLMPIDRGIDYTLVEAIKGTGVNGLYLPQYLIGSYLAVLVAAVGLWFRRRDRTTLLLLGMMVVFPAGYFVFWGNRPASGFAFIMGPVYYIPLLVPLCIFIATVLIRMWQRHRKALVALSCVFVLTTVPFLYDRVQKNHNISVAQAVWRDANDKIPAGSLVIVRDSGPYVMHLNPFGVNAPDLNGPVLYAVDRGAKVFDLLDRYPNRTPYLEMSSDTRFDDAIHHTDAPPPTISVLPITTHSGPEVTFRVEVENPTDQPAVVVTLQVDGQAQQRTLTADASGAYATEWTLVPTSSSRSTADGVVPVSGRGTVSIVAGAGTDPSAAVSGSVVRERYAYRVHDQQVQVLDPPRKTRYDLVDGLIVQRDVRNLSTLSVRVEAP